MYAWANLHGKDAWYSGLTDLNKEIALNRACEIRYFWRNIRSKYNSCVSNYHGSSIRVLSKANIFSFIDCDSIWNSISCWWFFRRRDREHSKTINEFFRQAKTLSVTKDMNDKATLNTASGLSVPDLPYSTYSTAHMKEYPTIQESWNRLNAITNGYNELLNNIDILLRTRIRVELAKKGNYPMHIAIYSKPTPHLAHENRCNILQMVNGLYKYLSTYQYEGRQTTDFTYYRVAIGDRHVLRDENQNILVESSEQEQSEKDKLIAIYDVIVGQDDVSQAFKELRETSNQMYSLVNLFTSQARILSEGIELGLIIKGKCSVGY